MAAARKRKMKLGLKLAVKDSDATEASSSDGTGTSTAAAATAAAVGGAQAAGKELAKKASFKVDGDGFEAHGVRITDEGVMLPGSGGSSEDSDGVVSIAGSGGSSIKFSDLEMLRDLGAGASSTVKLARDKATGKMYALKCISVFVKAMRHQLMSELRALFTADCEALVEFHGATYREGQVAVALEFMDLGGLDTVIRKVGRFPELPLAALAFQVLWGLGYMQVEKRVHRDIKPANILCASDGSAKLTDFGLSKEVTTALMAKTFVGTFKHLSPERMQSERYSYPADVWAIGLVLLECALGKYPYPESSSTIGYVTTIVDGPVPVPPKGGEQAKELGLQDDFLDFIGGAMRKDPEERPTAVEMLESPWMARVLLKRGIGSIEGCREILRDFFKEKGLGPKEGEGQGAGAGAASGGSGGSSAAAALPSAGGAVAGGAMGGDGEML